MAKETIYRWKCSCGKEINSLYPEQLENNKQIHILSCPVYKKGDKNAAKPTNI